MKQVIFCVAEAQHWQARSCNIEIYSRAAIFRAKATAFAIMQ
jgi:hypothetical protein